MESEQIKSTVEEQQSKEAFDKNVSRLTNQVKDTYKRAFFDLLEEKVGASPPDYEWLTRLYGEIRSKLIALLREGSQLRVEIEESMDCDFFKQLISHNVFSPENFYALIRYVFEKCKQLGSPARDTETDAKLQEIVDFVDSGDATFATLVPLFIKNANECLDTIYEDVQALSERFKKKK
ncbi:MAG: hypothetical protein HOK72_05315 [Flavobacteriales bacterium]|nr:hypothetical protein [Flavobacteriales bacterium]